MPVIKKPVLLFVVLLQGLFCFGSFAKQVKAPRIKLNFNTHWAFYKGDLEHAEDVNFNDSRWNEISIPHVMQLEKKHNGTEVFQGMGWYRRYFNLPQYMKNKRLTINFEGVQMNCELYLNGKKIASHFGGYMGFVIDITGKVNFDKKNVLALKVSNINDPKTPPGKAMNKLDFNYYAGIYRNVTLVATDKIFISDALEANKIAGGNVFISYSDVTSKIAKLRVKTNICNLTALKTNTRLVTELVNLEHITVAVAKIEKVIGARRNEDFEQKLEVKEPMLWHPDRPYLYTLISSVYQNGILIDRQETKTGIRLLSFQSTSGKADGFYINGEKLYLRGANRHQAYQYLGDAASDDMQVRDVKLLKKAGFNSVRAAHYPASTAFLNACDSLGLLVIVCQPGWQFYSEDSTFVKRSFRDIREMIRRDRNHPAIFLWETSLNESPTPASWMKNAVNIAHEEMPGNQMFTADDMNNRSKDIYDVLYKVINPDGTDPLLNKPSLTREWGDTWYADASLENGLRSSRMYTERGMINQCILRQNALNGETSEKLGGYWDHAGLDENPRIGGYFLWSFNDYTRGSDPQTAFSGVVDIDRYPKYGYYQMQSMQSALNLSYGPMVYIASNNSDKELDSAILVFSNCDAVRLYRNGVFIKEISRKVNAATAPFIYQKGGSPYFKFELGSYQKGEITAEGIRNGIAVCKHSIKTPDIANHLEIEVADEGISPIANGYEMVPVYIKVCDQNGTLISNKKSLESYDIELSVNGAGYLVGGNLKETGVSLQKTEGGIGYALIRVKGKPGIITLTAKSKGLQMAVANIKTKKSYLKSVPDAEHWKWVNEYESIKTKEKTFYENKALETKIDLKTISIKIGNELENENTKAIVDGNLNTVWNAGNSQLPIILNLDLKKIYELSGYKIFWGKDSDWYTHSIDLSNDNVNWISQESNIELSGQDYTIKKMKLNKVRYIRIIISSIRPEKSSPAIREFQLFQK